MASLCTITILPLTHLNCVDSPTTRLSHGNIDIVNPPYSDLKWKQLSINTIIEKPQELMRSQENCLSMVVSASLTNCIRYTMIFGWMRAYLMNGLNPLFSWCPFKKGDITKCENYRTISLINHSSKVLLEIIRSRMKPSCRNHLSRGTWTLYIRTGLCFEDPCSTSHWEEIWEGFCCIHR